MSTEFAHDKNTFRLVLAPIMDLLEYKKSQLSETEWLKFMEATKSRIIANPEQFLGRDLPTPALIQQSVQEIFTEYLEDQKLVV